LAVPGILLRYISRFEDSKVYGCCAFWTRPGGLNDLVCINDNVPTAGWWLYKWYCDMTGNTVKVTLPEPEETGFSALAAFDELKSQVRIIFGGSGQDTEIIIKGFEKYTNFKDKVHAIIWEIEDKGSDIYGLGKNPSEGPVLVYEGEYKILENEVRILVKGLKESSAYLLMMTPATCDHRFYKNDNTIEAEFAEVEGDVKIVYGEKEGYTGASYITSQWNSENNKVRFTIYAPKDGYYSILIRYSAGTLNSDNLSRQLKMYVNGNFFKKLIFPLTDSWDKWAIFEVKVFLRMGINLIVLCGFSGTPNNMLNIDSIEVVPSSGGIFEYEAESSQNILSGMVKVARDSVASGGKFVKDIGWGTENSLTFTNIYAPYTGKYKMVIYYSNAEIAGLTSQS
jgi:hypothetical protein